MQREDRRKKNIALISLSIQQVLSENLQFDKNVARKGNARNAHKSKQDRGVPVFRCEASKLVKKTNIKHIINLSGFRTELSRKSF